ncbi:MAG: 2OG-Fe(II) oxygenase, partial [Alphaproteobacteria bacterium]
DFTPTQLFSKQVNPAIRASTGLRQLGPYREMLESTIFSAVPAFINELRVTPFKADRLEIELVAHGDGAFYKRHIDTQTANYNDAKRIRILSGVYYFNAEPKAFSGGALRLYAIGAGADFLDVEPVRNTLLVFPSWAPHEVLPVSCLSRRFIDSRFAINCWVCRKKSAAAQ